MGFMIPLPAVLQIKKWIPAGHLAQVAMQPVMENDDVLNIFKKSADEYIYGVKDIDSVAKKLYREMSVYNTKEDDSK